MIQGERVQDQEFGTAEELYLRYGADQLVDGQLALGAIKFPEQSVNRGRYGEPEDVLFHDQGAYNGLGCIELRCSDIPREIRPDQGHPYAFTVKHEPDPFNYAHSLVWSEKIPTTGTSREPSHSVKLKFRIEVCTRLKADRIRIEAVRHLA